MKLSFHGAAGEVTGSCTLIDTGKTKFLVDCGLFQGSYFTHEENYEDWNFSPAEISFVVLTHAHADHCGRLPKLFADGFRGKVYCTPATRDLAELIMLDSAKLIKEEAEKKGEAPLYVENDVYGVLALFWPIDYHKKMKLASDVELNFYDAGHILGSAIAELSIRQGLKKKRIVFSGDLGNPPAPIVRDTEFIKGADFVVIESTYGGRIHEPAELREQMLKKAILESVGRGGVLMIPLFALERTQEVLYELNHLSETRQIPKVPIFLDSPLAIDAVNVYKKYFDYFDEQSRERMSSGDDLFKLPGLTLTRTVEQSKEINKVPPPKVILAGSGMINGGRMIHHLKLYIDNPKNQLLIISFQAEGTLGRALRDGAKSIGLEGEKYRVKAKVSAIGAYSSHADQPKLLHWLKKISRPRPQLVFINHGEEKSSLMLEAGVKEKLELKTQIVEKDKAYEI